MKRWIWIAMGLSVLPPACSSDACDCIAEYGNDAMSSEDIARLRNEGIDDCFARPESYPDDEFNERSDEFDENLKCLPRTVGRDARHGLPLVVYSFCQDICPTGDLVYVAYEGVDEAECDAIGGVPQREWASERYLRCQPP
jgi:hypothetical protein